jgi:hypothetical protein
MSMKHLNISFVVELVEDFYFYSTTKEMFKCFILIKDISHYKISYMFAYMLFTSPRCLDAKFYDVTWCTTRSGYRGPPTFSKWLKTIFWPFWQFTIFSRFSLPGPF